ncbi:transmembrane amino acid transporter protein-domain-containing protein [Elsinoe ampelina]|uniref:Transmembrane amino acid transporter protein-domain-containing protein n=1 Tax=Elsinoe ampelina TaxID=302913 RepID=A0A6A6GN32_9PEZI|nr:transmembrane amino acid transporter protein-domain-containing protein [Elsinoe ampelina]
MAAPPVTPSLGEYIAPQTRKLHDTAVGFEEYHFYAQQARREEAHNSGSAANGPKGFLATIFPARFSKSSSSNAASDPAAHDKAPVPNVNLSSHDARMHISESEWTNASRALRLATWPSMFYLITTDILGPYGLPYAVGTTGWGPAVALYTVFGFLAGYSGYLIWKMFLGLDSYQYPIKTYGDLAFRIYGPWARHGVNILQSVQLLCNVGVIVIQNGQSLSQVARFRLCYAICCLVFALAGFFLGQIRTLKRFGWLANFAIWLNLLVIFLTMGVTAHYPPNYDAAQSTSAGAAISGPGGELVAQLPDGSYPPIATSAKLPVGGNFGAAVTGLMQAVYSYGGAMLFTEFMSEMRRPYDFIKAMWGAQAFIYFFYMLYGLYMYGFYGQYVVNPSYQGMSPYNWQVACNSIAMVSALIAAALYGNIGIKVLYNNVLVELFRAPPLESKGGKLLWIAIVPIYWTVAFIIAAAIPNFSGLTSVVAAACILQFTYTFPPILYLGYSVQRDALRLLGLAPATNHSSPNRPNSAVTTSPTHHSDSGSDNDRALSSSEKPALPPYSQTATAAESERFHPGSQGAGERKSAIMKALYGNGAKKSAINLWLVLYALGALCTAALGMWAGITALITAFKEPQVTAFTCKSPLDSS